MLKENKDYSLRKTDMNDSLFCYEVKKTVLYAYVKSIWGWDEEMQEKFHEENFHPGLIHIIEYAGNDIGTVEVVVSEGLIFISSLYLLPAWQGKGIGTAIICSYMDMAKEMNSRIALEVLKLNTGAIRLYKKLGFVQAERDENKYLMYKDL